jgi:hypothetical protein
MALLSSVAAQEHSGGWAFTPDIISGYVYRFNTIEVFSKPSQVSLHFRQNLTTVRERILATVYCGVCSVPPLPAQDPVLHHRVYPVSPALSILFPQTKGVCVGVRALFAALILRTRTLTPITLLADPLLVSTNRRFTHA